MHIVRIILALGFMASASLSSAADGLITLQSPYSAEQTLQRLEQQVVERTLSLFARIDHAAGAAKVGKTLRPTVLLLFGNPRGGTPFMQCAQTVGIDLPLKVLVWVDATGQVRLGYNDPAFIARRHGVENCPVVDKLAKALGAITTATIGE